MMPAQERLVLPDVGLDSGIAPAFGAASGERPAASCGSTRKANASRVRSWSVNFFRVLVAQEGARGQAGDFPGQDRPEPGELIAAAVGMAGNQGERGIRVRLEPAAPFQPHPHQPIPLFLLACQAAEITQHQHDGARIGHRVSARMLGRQLDPRVRGAILENRELEPALGIDLPEMS